MLPILKDPALLLKTALHFTLFGILLGLGRAQGVGFEVPDGRRHFIVFVDRSFSMQKDLVRDLKVHKAQALALAERGLADLLYGRRGGTRWYRRGRDLITIVHFGFDAPRHNQPAYLQLSGASLDRDYVRRSAYANDDLSKAEFLRRLRPWPRTPLNILAWSLPLGLQKAMLGSGSKVQETFVILLNDAQLNEGSLVLEKTSMALRLPRATAERLRSAESAQEKLVRLTDDDGRPGARLVRTYGDAADPVVLTVFNAVSMASMSRAKSIRSSEPLRSASLHWDKQEGKRILGADVSTSDGVRGLSGRLVVANKSHQAVSETFPLGESRSVQLTGDLGDIPGEARVTLRVLDSVPNSLLGSQTIVVPAETVAWLPEPPDSFQRRLLFWTGLAGVGILGLATAAWAYYHRAIARHVALFLSDYVTRFPLPSISQGLTQRFITREIGKVGEAAVQIELPHRTIRRIFYAGATLQWEGPLVLHNDAKVTEVPLDKLPRVARLDWASEPSPGDSFAVTIVRPGRNQRLNIIVTYLALSPAPKALANPLALTRTPTN